MKMSLHADSNAKVSNGINLKNNEESLELQSPNSASKKFSSGNKTIFDKHKHKPSLYKTNIKGNLEELL